MSARTPAKAMIDLLMRDIEGDKEPFIAELRTAIQQHVEAKNPAECLAVVSRRNGLAVTWRIHDGPPYVMRLVAFVREKPYTEAGLEYEVDSVLTGEILEIVLAKLGNVILSHAELIGDIALAEIMMRDATRERFLDAFLKDNVVARAAGDRGKAIVASALLHGVQQKLQHVSASISSNVSEKAGHLLAGVVKSGIVTNSAALTAKLAATGAGKFILMKLSVAMAESLAPLVAKLLAMPLIQVALKKFVAVAIVATLAKLIAAKVGMSVASAAMVILIPVILIWLVRDIMHLPKKLGAALAAQVCGELEKAYTTSMQEIVVALIAEFTSRRAVDALAKTLGADLDVTKELTALIVTA